MICSPYFNSLFNSSISLFIHNIFKYIFYTKLVLKSKSNKKISQSLMKSIEGSFKHLVGLVRFSISPQCLNSIPSMSRIGSFCIFLQLSPTNLLTLHSLSSISCLLKDSKREFSLSMKFPVESQDLEGAIQ
jgi:hypothetical protein